MSTLQCQATEEVHRSTVLLQLAWRGGEAEDGEGSEGDPGQGRPDLQQVQVQFRISGKVRYLIIQVIPFEQEGDKTFWEQFESEVSEFKSKTAGMEESKVTIFSSLLLSCINCLILLLPGVELDPGPHETTEQLESTLWRRRPVRGGRNTSKRPQFKLFCF